MAKGIIKEFRPASATGFRWGEAAFVSAQVLTLALLLYHAYRHAFLTDDAFLSFRYARNLAEGYGLVFNPGQPPVEGFGGLLWVLVLSVLAYLGVGPEAVSHGVTIGATMVLWWLVAEFASRDAPEGRKWMALVPPLLLAATRSVAVWTSGGLETRLVEVLVLGGVIRLVTELRAVLRRRDAPWPASGLLFGLAALARGDAILVAVCAFAAAGWVLAMRGRLDLPRFAVGPAIFAAIVVAHVVFRWIVFRTFLPPDLATGGPGWSTGWTQHATFFLEYSVWLWLPLIVLGVVSYRRRGLGWVPLLFGAVVLPHVLYVAATGGDFFEYRLHDLWFPFAFLLVFEGLKVFPAGRGGTAGAVATAAVLLTGLVVLPLGTPAIPGLTRAHQGLLESTAQHSVGIRQEVHRDFVKRLTPEAERLRELVREGTLPEDTSLAVDAAGVIGYTTDLRVVDRLGRTEPTMGALYGAGSERRSAVTRELIDSAADVDLWAWDASHLLFRADDPVLGERMDVAAEQGIDVHVADAGEAWILLAAISGGTEAARERFPELEFRAP